MDALAPKQPRIPCHGWASLVPEASVIPAPRAYVDSAAAKMLVVGHGDVPSGVGRLLGYLCLPRIVASPSEATTKPAKAALHCVRILVLVSHTMGWPDICEQISAIQAGVLPLNAEAWNLALPAKCQMALAIESRSDWVYPPLGRPWRSLSRGWFSMLFVRNGER